MSEGTHSTARTELSLDEMLCHCLWHLPFFPTVTAHQYISSAVPGPTSSEKTLIALVCSAALVESVGYSKAGQCVQQLLASDKSGESSTRFGEVTGHSCGSAWKIALHQSVLAHVEQLVSPNSSSSSSLLKVILESTQQRYAAEKKTRGATVAPCDDLFARLCAEYLRCAATASTIAAESSPSASAVELGETLFQFAPRSPSTAPPRTLTPTQQRQQRSWYEARLYGAMACSASLATLGPLARLLVAYAHREDGRLAVVVAVNLKTHAGGKQDDTNKTTEDALAASAAEMAAVRLSGIVAGVLEYILHVARVRSALSVTALSSYTPSLLSSTANLAEHASPLEVRCGTKLSQSAALLFVQLVEECGYYHQGEKPAAGSAMEDGASVTVAAAVVHAVQEVLFTIVLGSGTVGMGNRPEWTAQPMKKPMQMPSVGHAGSTEGRAAMLVSTARPLSLCEADACVVELFPGLVQQMGLEWVWSPLLRHLASLDKQQPSATSSALNSAQRAALPIRWSSHAVMDMILLALAQKSYPKRLLSILPGSFDRLLEKLDLLPTLLRAQPGDDDSATAIPKQPLPSTLFTMPPYYAESAAAVVAYLARAGASGLRVEEAWRVLSTVTNSHNMVVRLRAQAPSRAEMADMDDEGKEEGESEHGDDDATVKSRKSIRGVKKHGYVLSAERVAQLLARYQAEVLLTAVVVHTQLQIPSQVQQFMRGLSPLFLKLQLDWRRQNDGSVAGWILQRPRDAEHMAATAPQHFTAAATVLLEKVGYEFYPLEWMPALAASLRDTLSSNADMMDVAEPLPYSLFAAVGHQFNVQLRGTPLGNSGDISLRHPSGPRNAAVLPPVEGMMRLASKETGATVAREELTKTTAAAWRRSERFLHGLMFLCYLDAKTSSTDLEGTMAVSSTRRVLTSTGAGGAGAGVYGGVAYGDSAVVSAADVAAHRLRSLLQQPGIMDAVWGSMTKSVRAASGGGEDGAGRVGSGSYAAKRPRSSSSCDAGKVAQHLQSLEQLLLDYGAASFDTTVEAADFALFLAQSFLPSSASTTALAAGQGGSSATALLQSATQWCRDVAASSATRARVSMLLQQAHGNGGHGNGAQPLALAYNSATVDLAWLARSALRQVPSRILEKIELNQAEKAALSRRRALWSARLPGAAAEREPSVAARQKNGVDPLLLEQWTQWIRVTEQLGFTGSMANAGEENAFGVSSAISTVTAADGVRCAQWLWYSPYFSAEWER